ncbi:MAG: hydrolase [Bacteroidetes bacterium MedPE-SWsnd-G2]|nr:MAG: hydrolase [Bacteroidetes bacterium MedPE-SWsnd-G2]
MQEEYLEILTTNGEFTGKSCLKSEIHKKGIFHPTVHIWLYTKNGEVLLQQRAKSKLICPNLWDVSAAGHIAFGESLIEGGLRELEEEIGVALTPNNLFKIGINKCMQTYDNGIIDNEFHHVYIAEFNSDISKLQLQEEEVQAVKLVTIPEFKSLLENSKQNSHFIESNRAYYEFVIEAIQKKISL